MRYQTVTFRVMSFCLIFGLLAIASTAFAREQKVLYSFCALSKCSDGQYPFGGVIMDKAGNLYGATQWGGAYNDGIVFELIPTGNGEWKQQILHTFGSQPNDGSGPLGELLLDSSGNLYGTTISGGAFKYGTVYELVPDNGIWTETILHNFSQNGFDGSYPNAGLVSDESGNLYGTTFYGCPL